MTVQSHCLSAAFNRMNWTKHIMLLCDADSSFQVQILDPAFLVQLLGKELTLVLENASLTNSVHQSPTGN